MNLVRLVYTSEETESVSMTDLEGIIAVAKYNNERDRLTGILVYNRPFFIQCLEGDRAIVSGLIERLYRDRRHTNRVIHSLKEIHERQFTEWSMRLIRLEDLRSSVVKSIGLKYGIDLPLRLPSLRARQLFSWLRDINHFVDASTSLCQSESAPSRLSVVTSTPSPLITPARAMSSDTRPIESRLSTSTVGTDSVMG